MPHESVSTLPTQYERLVKAGREARKHVDDYQWVEGELALQVEHLPPGDGPRDEKGVYLPGVKALEQYAADIDINYSTLKVYRATAAVWPAARRRAAAFDVHRTLNDQPDRFDLIKDGMTRRDARAIVEGRNRASRHVPGWFELLGEVGDTLIKASKQLERAEEAIDRAPDDRLRANANRYADGCLDLAKRLRAIAE